jgi:hypothetical protein
VAMRNLTLRAHIVLTEQTLWLGQVACHAHHEYDKRGESPGKGKRDYSFLHDAFKQTGTGRPRRLLITWDDLDPPKGTLRQLNKGRFKWRPGAST